MNTGRRARLFGAAFALTLGVIAIAAILRSSDAGSEADVAPIDVTSATTTVDVPPSPTQTTSPETTTSLGPREALPTLDFSQVCAEVEGPGTQFVDDGGRFALACRTADGQDLPIDVRNACETAYGEGSRAVLIELEEGADAWRCSARQRVALGTPNWDLECVRRFGGEAAAFLIADDSLGWRCGSLRNGVYVDDEIALDAACQTTWGPQTFGEVMGPLPDDNVCYSAA